MAVASLFLAMAAVADIQVCAVTPLNSFCAADMRCVAVSAATPARDVASVILSMLSTDG
ncbi:hypothetical protein [Herbaspirillum sp. ST 5-3]|uniref:hypothetical protein n=1 Tax=Oxalobacteraceae TaxID=75682 RepID=UPI0020001F2E|nr:hypothetical protein [Herbaspirillum sp. ST 5-3]